MMTLHHMPLAQSRLWWGDMAATQTERSLEKYRATLEGYQAAGAFAVLAREAGRIVGTTLWMPFASPDMPAPRGTIIRALIYVAEDARGQNLGGRMRALSAREARARGYRYSIGWGYETAAIASWVERMPEKIATGRTDPNGFPVYLLPLALQIGPDP